MRLRPGISPSRLLVHGPLAPEVAGGVATAAPDLAVRIAERRALTAEEAAWADSWTGFGVPRGLAASGVRWVHSMAAGVDGAVPTLSALPPDRDVVLTRTVSAMPRAIGRYVVAHVLADVLRLPEYADQQARGEWRPHPPTTPEGTTVAVLGTGEIGTGVAAALRANGLRVVGVNTRGAQRPGFDAVVALGHARDHLAASTALVLALPLTPATRGLVDADLLASLDGALVVNVGRGATLVAQDLRTALDARHVRRAVLDVVETEPLPAHDWRWSHPRVTLTPHVAGPTSPNDVVAALVEARAALLAGRRPPLAVDVARGY